MIAEISAYFFDQIDDEILSQKGLSLTSLQISVIQNNQHNH